MSNYGESTLNDSLGGNDSLQVRCRSCGKTMWADRTIINNAIQCLLCYDSPWSYEIIEVGPTQPVAPPQQPATEPVHPTHIHYQNQAPPPIQLPQPRNALPSRRNTRRRRPTGHGHTANINVRLGGGGKRYWTGDKIAGTIGKTYLYITLIGIGVVIFFIFIFVIIIASVT